MREITVPADINLVDLVTGESIEAFSYYRWLVGRAIRDPKFAQNREGKVDDQGAYYGLEIWQKFKGKKGGDKVRIEEECHRRLLSSVTSPQVPYDPGIMCQCTTFFDSVKDAVKIDPADAA